MRLLFKRSLHVSRPRAHDNPLGLPKVNPISNLNRPGQSSGAPPGIPRRGSGPPQKRKIPHVGKVVAVASGKGGVGKSTVAVNLAAALALHPRHPRLRVGILDLDIFGPSVPKLMGLDRASEPALTSAGAIIPLTNHGIPCMSMGFLLPSSPSSSSSSGSTEEDSSNTDTPVVWRGLMVQKAVQQLLFDVDWRARSSFYGEDSNSNHSESGPGLDILVIDLPPGTGDVPLTLGQLVEVDGTVIVSTPQDVSLSDVRKGIAMFRKINIPLTGLLLNHAHTTCPACQHMHYPFGDPANFRALARRLGIPVLAELPVAGGVSAAGDGGVPGVLRGAGGGESGGDVEKDEREWVEGMRGVAEVIVGELGLGER